MLAELKQDSLAAELQCSSKTVDRTLKVLELAGIPLVHDTKSRTIQIQDNCLIPPVTLSAEEFLDAARASAVVKSQTDVKPTAVGLSRTSKAIIPRGIRSIVDAASTLISVLELKNVDHHRSADALRSIQVALATDRQLETEYFSPYNESTARMFIHPCRLCFIRSAWYLIGRPDDADRPQVYRVVRFCSIQVSDKPSVVPDDFCIESFLGNAWGVYRGEQSYQVAIRFHGSAAHVVGETRWHRTQQVDRNQDGTVTLRFHVDGLEEIVWWLMSWAPFARVEQPNELRVRLLEELKNGIMVNR